MMKDKRKSVRRPVQYTAWIAQQGQPLRGCVLSDISESGARLDVDDDESVPDEFMLFLSQRGSARRRCRVAWRSDGQIGVKFEVPQAPPKKKSKVQAMIAARQAALQPDMDAADDAPAADHKPAGPDEKEPA